jgi:hypothetical protein
MSEKRYASYYGKYDSVNSTLPFGTTVNDGSTSTKSSLPNMIQTSIIPKDLGGNPNSIQQTTIITSDSKVGTFSSNTYDTNNALNGSATANIALNYDFIASAEKPRVYKVSSDIVIVAKIDNLPLDHVPDIVHTRSFKLDACIIGAKSDYISLDNTSNVSSRLLPPATLTSLTQTAGSDTYISNNAISASITGGTLTFTFTATSTPINYSYDALIKTDIISMDIN